MVIYVNISSISIFSLFLLVFNHDFVIYIDFTHVAASNAASNNVTNYLIQTYNIILLILY